MILAVGGLMLNLLKKQILNFTSRFKAALYSCTVGNHTVMIQKNLDSICICKEQDLDNLKTNYVPALDVKSIPATELFLRTITLPLTDFESIQEAINHQIPSLFPKLIQPCLSTFEILEQHNNKSVIHCFAANQTYQPISNCDHLTALPLSLPAFIHQFFPSLNQSAVIFHVSQAGTLLILRDQNRLIDYVAVSEPIEIDYSINNLEWIKQTLREWQNLYSLPSLNVLCTGDKRALLLEVLNRMGLKEKFKGSFLPDLNQTPSNVINNSIEALSHATHAALAPNINLLSSAKKRLSQFKRLKPIFILSLGIACVSWTLLWATIKVQQKQKLSSLQQSLQHSLQQYYPESPPFAPQLQWDSSEVQEITSQWNADNIESELEILQKSIKSAPQTYALFPNTPKAIDTIAWLAQVAQTISNRNPDLTFQINKFQYKMVKRPSISRPNDKYQIKVFIEVVTPDPEAAKQFYNTIYEPNPFIDHNNDIKWTASQGSYQVSFFLKDKTFYPSSSRSRR